MRKFVSPAPVLTTARDTTEVRKGFSEVSKWSADVLHDGDKFDAATVGGLDVADIAETSKDPTGFTDPENVAVSFDSTTTKVSLSGSVKAYFHGEVVKALVNGWTSPALSDSYATPNTGYFLYYDGSDFLWSATAWTFDLLQIAYVYYSAAGSYLFATHETHGLMPWSVHEITHRLLGTYKLSGGVVSGVVLASTTAADRRPLLTATVLMDEDCKTTAAALASASYTREYLAGAGAVNTWAAASGDIVALSGANPYWNEYTGGAWAQTLMANNSYMAVWVAAIPVSSDSGAQAYRYLFIQGQMNGNLATIQALVPQGLNLGSLTTIAPEFVIFKKIIIQYTASNWNITEIQEINGARYSQVTSVPGAAGNAATVTLEDEATDTTCHIVFAPSATGQQPLKTNASLSFDASTGRIGGALTDITSLCTITGWAAGYSANISAKILGATVHIYYFVSGISNSTTTRIVLPTSFPNIPFDMCIATGRTRDNGIWLSGAMVFIPGGAKTLDWYVDGAGTTYQNSGSKYIMGYFIYDAV